MAEKGSPFKDIENGLGQEFNVANKMSKHKLEKKPSKTAAGQGKVTLSSVSLAGFAAALGSWDPLKSSDWDEEPPSSQCLLRVKRDIMSIYQSPPPGMFIYPDEKVMTKIHALLTGPFDTPYEGGFFYFVLRCPPDYPIRPPRVKLMTTGESKVRFNPNLYRNGKVCLSILGTWSGPAWSPAQSLSSVLISIQSLLNEKPYFNEPGFEKERYPGDSNRLNEILRHETLRVAVCDMMERTTTDSKDCPDVLKEVMDKSFLEFMDFYNSTITQNIHLTGHKMMDPFGERRGTFDYKSIKERIEVIHAEIEKKKEAKDDKAKKDQLRTEEWLSDCSSDGS